MQNMCKMTIKIFFINLANAVAGVKKSLLKAAKYNIIPMMGAAAQYTLSTPLLFHKITSITPMLKISQNTRSSILTAKML